MNRIVEWYNANSLRKYPLHEHANITSGKGIEIPNSLIIDGQYHANEIEISIVSINVANNVLSITLSDGSTCNQEIDLYQIFNRANIINACGINKGFFIFGDGISFVKDIFGEELHTFSNCPLEYSTVHVINCAVTSVGIEGEDALTGNVQLKFDKGSHSEIDGNEITLSSFNDFTNCPEPTEQPIKSINSVTPDANGNIFISVSDIMSIEAINNGIAVSTVIKQGEQCVRILDPASKGADGPKGAKGDDGKRGACRQVKAICCECEVCDTVENCATCETCNTCEQCNNCETCNTCEADDQISTPPPPLETEDTCPECVEIWHGQLDPSEAFLLNPIIIEEDDTPENSCLYERTATFTRPSFGSFTAVYKLEYLTDRWIYSITAPGFGLIHLAEKITTVDNIGGSYTITFTLFSQIETEVIPRPECPEDTGDSCPDCLEISLTGANPLVVDPVVNIMKFFNPFDTSHPSDECINVGSLGYLRTSFTKKISQYELKYTTEFTEPAWKLTIRTKEGEVWPPTGVTQQEVTAYRTAPTNDVLGSYQILDDTTSSGSDITDIEIAELGCDRACPEIAMPLLDDPANNRVVVHVFNFSNALIKTVLLNNGPNDGTGAWTVEIGGGHTSYALLTDAYYDEIFSGGIDNDGLGSLEFCLTSGQSEKLTVSTSDPPRVIIGNDACNTGLVLERTNPPATGHKYVGCYSVDITNPLSFPNHYNDSASTEEKIKFIIVEDQDRAIE